MIFGETLRNKLNVLKALTPGLPLALLPQAAFAQDAAAPAVEASAAPAAAAAAGGYVPMGPEMIKGQPQGLT